MRLPFRAAVQVRRGPDTEHSFATVSHGMAVLIRRTPRMRGGVQVAPQTGLAGEGLFHKGRADATVIPSYALLVLPWGSNRAVVPGRVRLFQDH
jgi:hypothetical protein